MRLELLLSFGTTSLAFCAMVGGFFGMNLDSGVQEVEGLFWLATGVTVSAGAAIFGGLVFSVRRFHVSQQRQIARTASLERALTRLDDAYFGLRRQGVLIGEAGGGRGGGGGGRFVQSADSEPVVTREELSRALQSVDGRMQPADVDALFKLLDTDGSGVLTKDELGLRGEAAEAVARYHGWSTVAQPHFDLQVSHDESGERKG